MKLNCLWILLILRRWQKISSKEVDIRTHGQEIIYTMTILWIVTDGTKLPPILAFKDQPDSRVDRILHKH